MRPVEGDQVPCAEQTRQLTEIISIVTSDVFSVRIVNRGIKRSDDISLDVNSIRGT